MTMVYSLHVHSPICDPEIPKVIEVIQAFSRDWIKDAQLDIRVLIQNDQRAIIDGCEYVIQQESNANPSVRRLH